MRNRKSKQIVTGILAVILIITMLIGVVSPVFAVEDKKAGKEALFDFYEVDVDYGDLWILSSSTEKLPHLGDLELLMKSDTATIWGTSKCNGLRFVIGENTSGYLPLVYSSFELTDEAGNPTGEFSNWLQLSDTTESSLDNAISKADIVESDVMIHVPTNPNSVKNVSDYEKFLLEYKIYVMDKSGTIKYEIPFLDCYKWTEDYINYYGSSSFVESSEVENSIFKTEVSSDVNESESVLSTDIDEVVETDESVELSVTESSSDLVDTSTGILFTSVDLSILSKNDSAYTIHVSIKKPEDVVLCGGYCKSSNDGAFIYNTDLLSNEFDFEVSDTVNGNIYFVVEAEDGSASTSNLLTLDNYVVNNLDDITKIDYDVGDFKVWFSGLPDLAKTGESVVIKMETELPCKMKFNDVIIGKNTFGTSFDVVLSSNGSYNYEAVSEDGKKVSGVYDVSIFEDMVESSGNNIVVLICCVVVIGITCIMFYLYKIKRRSGNVETEISEEDL